MPDYPNNPPLTGQPWDPHGPSIPTWPGPGTSPYPAFPPRYVPERQAAPKFYPVTSGTNDVNLVIVLDESSSMLSCFEQTCSGFDELILTHKNADEAKSGRVFVTLITFNGSTVRTRFENKPIAEVPPLKTVYNPSGNTNLLDAIGETLDRVNNTLTNIPMPYRPGVIVAIFTDGEENSSRIFNNDDIRDRVKAAEKQEWTFTFFGANIDAFSVGSMFGMGAHNTMQYSTNNMAGTMAVASASMLATRSAKVGGYSNEEIYASMYSDEDRKKAL